MALSLALPRDASAQTQGLMGVECAPWLASAAPSWPQPLTHYLLRGAGTLGFD